MYNIKLVKMIFDAANIQRWNDHNRTQYFTELDKQAHKMIIAYVLAKHEEDAGLNVNWQKIIEGGIFEFLHRIILTDIKPPVFHLLQKESKLQMDTWVLEQLEPLIKDIPYGFKDKFAQYLAAGTKDVFEKKILQASHYLATKWEFKFIYNLNTALYGIEETKKAIDLEIEEYYDLKSVQKLVLYKKEYDFIDLVGQLRFQKRWAQTPRIPETSVLGHMLIVAILSYFFSLELQVCDKRLRNNFYAGLFHDLPEVLTRDIISPVKRSIEGLDLLIKNIEEKYMQEKIYNLLPVNWHSEIKYYTENEFKNKIINNSGEIEYLSVEMLAQYNKNIYNPLDGEMLKFCDNLSALLEVLVSRQHGVTSQKLEDAIDTISRQYTNRKIEHVSLQELIENFTIALKN